LKEGGGMSVWMKNDLKNHQLLLRGSVQGKEGHFRKEVKRRRRRIS